MLVEEFLVRHLGEPVPVGIHIFLHFLHEALDDPLLHLGHFLLYHLCLDGNSGEASVLLPMDMLHMSSHIGKTLPAVSTLFFLPLTLVLQAILPALEFLFTLLAFLLGLRLGH